MADMAMLDIAKPPLLCLSSVTIGNAVLSQEKLVKDANPSKGGAIFGMHLYLVQLHSVQTVVGLYQGYWPICANVATW